jgi:hypothetical protein
MLYRFGYKGLWYSRGLDEVKSFWVGITGWKGLCQLVKKELV